MKASKAAQRVFLMPEAWRIVKAKHAATAFSGDGAAKTGGRWNSRGVPMGYASSAGNPGASESAGAFQLRRLSPPVRRHADREHSAQPSARRRRPPRPSVLRGRGK